MNPSPSTSMYTVDAQGKRHYRLRCEPGAIGAVMSGAFMVNGETVDRDEFVRVARELNTPEARAILLQLGETL